MASSVRDFECVDPFGVTWQVKFLWHQVGIAIRHADTIDCKFQLTSADEQIAKVIALEHVHLKHLAAELVRDITDPWVMQLAGNHLRYMVESGEDMDKTLVTLSMDDLRRSLGAVAR
ncbi:MAG: hypothetical protein MUF01_05500 [Bryobacterales bacterium]|jgi:hypothetical protein|nr:hypothetical protein [Bryobacterales bacterium]